MGFLSECWGHWFLMFSDFLNFSYIETFNQTFLWSHKIAFCLCIIYIYIYIYIHTHTYTHTHTHTFFFFFWWGEGAVYRLFVAVCTFSSCSDQGLLYFWCASFSLGSFSCCREWALGPPDSLVVSLGLYSAGWVVAHSLGSCHISFRTRDLTCVPCICRQILNHWTTCEVP